MLSRPFNAVSNHARVHSLSLQAATLLAWCALSAVATRVVFLIPDTDGFITLPFRNFVPAGVAISTVGYAILPADRAYPVITDRLARARHITLAASVTLAAAAIFLTTWAGSRDAQVALQCASSVAIWSAIAVVSTRLWGRAFGWVLPLASIGIIPRWFNWSDVAAPSHNWWITLAITAAAAMLATSLTRWRRYGLMPTHRSQTRQRRKAVRQILTGPSRTPVHSDRNGIQSD